MSTTSKTVAEEFVNLSTGEVITVNRAGKAVKVCKTHIINRKQIEGVVESNDGDFAEIETNGIQGIEEGLLLDTITIEKLTKEVPEHFQRRLPVGMWVDIETVITVQQPLVEGASPSPSFPERHGSRN